MPGRRGSRATPPTSWPRSTRTAWISVLGLLDECPILPETLTAILERRTAPVSPTAFQFISTTAQIGDIRVFHEDAFQHVVSLSQASRDRGERHPGRLTLLATEVPCLVGAAAADVVCRRRIRAQRPSAVDDAGWSGARLRSTAASGRFRPSDRAYPLVEDVSAWAALAMCHARHHEQRDRIRARRSDAFEIRSYMIRLVSGETSGSAQP
jgi:hypothetical protein